MTCLIDGHNLIPYIPGLQLQALDDEMRLVELLQSYSRVRRQPVEVFFDGAPPGNAGERRFGTVKAHFVRLGYTADEAIIKRLRQLGAAAQNWTVVSSDRRVRSEANSLGANCKTSAEFARELIDALSQDPSPNAQAPTSTPAEIEEWLRIFKQGRKDKS